MSYEYYDNIKKRASIESEKDVKVTGTYWNESNFFFEMYAVNPATKERSLLGVVTGHMARDRPEWSKEHEARIWKAFQSSNPWMPRMIVQSSVSPERLSFQTFQESCARTSKGYRAPVIEATEGLGKLLYNCLGLAGEAGEVVEIVKKSLRTDPMGPCSEAQHDALLRELGDVLYYVAQMATNMGWSFEKVANTNILRREKRWLKDEAN